MGRKRKDKGAGDAEATEPEEGAPKQRRSLGSMAVPVACLAVGALLGPKILGTDGTAQASNGEAEETAPTTTEPEKLGEVVVLEPVTVNLADGHALKVGLAFQLAAEAKHVKPEKDDPTKGFARAIDASLDSLGQRAMADLIDHAGREAAKEQLVDRLDALTHGEVVDVYFHQFVMG